MASSSRGASIPPAMADPSATTGSELTELDHGHATSVGRGTVPLASAMALAWPAWVLARPVGALARPEEGLVGELPKKAMEGPVPVKVSFKQTMRLEIRKQDMWYVKKMVLSCFNLLQIANNCNFITIVSMIQN